MGGYLGPVREGFREGGGWIFGPCAKLENILRFDDGQLGADGAGPGEKYTGHLTNSNLNVQKSP